MQSVDSDSEAGTDYGSSRRKPLISFGGTKQVPPHQDESFIDTTPTHSVEVQDHIPIGSSPVFSGVRGNRSPSDLGDGVLSLAQYTTEHYVSVYAQQHDREHSHTDGDYFPHIHDDAAYSDEMDPGDATPEAQ